MILPPGINTLGYFPTLVWILQLFSSEKHVAKAMGFYFQEEVAKRLWFPAEAPSVLLLAQKGSQLLRSELPYGEVGMARSWHLWSAASEELRPADSLIREVKNVSYHPSRLEMTTQSTPAL